MEEYITTELDEILSHNQSDMKRLVCGVGINDADYVVKVMETTGYVNGKQKRKLIWICPFYQTWNSMIQRAYNAKYNNEYPTYRNVSVCIQWHRFSTFKAWMVKQDWEGKQLDKDVLIRGNKVHGPETCVFVSREVNMFLTDGGGTHRGYMMGVYWHKATSKFMAKCCNSFSKKQEYLGVFNSELGAHKAWLKRKLELAYELSATQTDARVAQALVERYANYNDKGGD